MAKTFAILFLFCALWIASVARALPFEERLPGSGDAPLDILSAQPEKLYVPTFGDFKDKYIFVINGSTLTMIDTETWEEYANLPAAFSTDVVGVTLLGNGTSLVIALANGNLARIELDDETSFVPEEEEEDTSTSDDSDNDSSSDSDNDSSDDEEDDEPADSREINVSQYMASAGLSAITANPESEAETVYLLNQDGQYYYEYTLSNKDFLEVALGTDNSSESTSTTEYTPVDIAYANSDSGADVLVTTTEGALLAFEPGTGSYTAVALAARDSNDATPSLSEIDLTADNNHAFVLDTANDFVWVYAVQSLDFADQTSGGTSLDPIEFNSSSENTELAGLAVFYDEASASDYAYVGGSLGLSVLDGSDAGSRSSETKIVDADESTTDVFEPLTLSGTAALVAASSSEDGYLYTANGDATVSVVTDNPFVTIGSISTDNVTADNSTFFLVFQTDEAGTYTVRANSDPSGADGTELIATTTVSETDNDVTTITLDINTFDPDNSRNVFQEGANKIHVFVTDAEGHTGRDAVYLNVDRPPGPVDINALDFGNEKTYVTFTASEDDDIASYTLYAEPAESQSSPSCPGTLTFGSASTVTETVTTSVCDGSSCEAIIDGLTNDTYYCVAIRATDNAGQAGTLSGYTNAVRPEATVGPARFMGETGCALNSEASRRPPWKMLGGSIFLASAGLVFLGKKKIRRGARKIFIHSVAGFLLMMPTRTARAELPLDPEHFTLETRASLWIPTRDTVKNFFSACCNPVGEIEFGYLHDNRYNPAVTAGFSYLTGRAIGINNGLPSGDRFSLMLIPVRADFVYRFDFKPDQLFVPFLRAGFDAVMFIENSSGEKTKGTKFGVHGGGGLSILLDHLDGGNTLETSGTGINDVYFVIEGRYAYLNSFRSTGLDLSGFYPYAGFLLQF